MNYNEEKFKQHIKEVVAITDIDSDRPLSLSELKELASSMGVADKDWDKLQAEASQNLIAAEKHLSARNFVDAVSAADKATAINPYIKDGNSVLAQAYLMQWIDDSDPEKLNKAEYFARKEVKVDPNDRRAINILSTIQNKKRIAKDGGKIKKKIFIGLGISVLLFIITIILYSSNESSEASDHLIEVEENVNAKWGDVEAAMDRRNKLIPGLITSLSSESPQLNNEIEDLQKKTEKSEGQNRFDLEDLLEDKITEAKLLIKKNGSYKTNLIIEIEGAENRINFARKEYNKAVKEFNILVKKNTSDFPEYKAKPYFE
jgi:LemA protein